jgi:hypothetical protein
MKLSARAEMIFQILASAFVLYHLICMVWLPNSSSFFVESNRAWLTPYANQFGLNTTWQFFSPNPWPPTFLEYEVVKEGGKRETYTFPDQKRAGFFRDNYNRHLTALMLSQHLPKYMRLGIGPFLCRQHPEAQTIELSMVVVRPPSLDDVAGRWLRMTDLSNREYRAMPLQHCLSAKESAQ